MKCHFKRARASVRESQTGQLIAVFHQVHQLCKPRQWAAKPNTALLPKQLASFVRGQVKAHPCSPPCTPRSRAASHSNPPHSINCRANGEIPSDSVPFMRRLLAPPASSLRLSSSSSSYKNHRQVFKSQIFKCTKEYFFKKNVLHHRTAGSMQEDLPKKMN